MMQPVIRKNHMDIAWHEYTDENGADIPVTQASLTEKASIIAPPPFRLHLYTTVLAANTK